MSSTYTLGDFATALNGIAESLDNIAAQLGNCDASVELDKTPGRSWVCHGPPSSAGNCGTQLKDPFTVADLLEVVEGLRDWVTDVRDKIGIYDAASVLDSGSWTPNETTD